MTVRREVRQNGSVNLVATTGGPPGSVGEDPTGAAALGSLFDLLDPQFARTVTEDGREYALLVARSERVDGANRAPVGAVDLRASVAPDGTVAAYRLTYRTTQFGREAFVVSRFRLSDVGETTVGRPSWVPAALPAAGGANATATADAHDDLSSPPAGRTPRAPGRTAGRG